MPVKVSRSGSQTSTGTLTLKQGATLLGNASDRVAAGRGATVHVEPTSRGACTIARARSHKVTVELKPRSGDTIRTRLTLRRQTELKGAWHLYLHAPCESAASAANTSEE